MHYRRNDIVFVPSDLTVFLESEFASWMDRREAERRAGKLPPGQAESSFESAPDTPAEEELLVERRGLEHERRFVEKLRADGREVIEVDRGEGAAARSLTMMREGRDIIYQGHLAAGGFEGRPDLLVRVRDEARPAPIYEPWDAKLARSPKPAAVIQLCAYADLVEKTLGARPRWITLALGSGELVRLPTDDYFFYYSQLKRAFLDFQAAFDAEAMPDPGMSASHGRWSTCAAAIFEASDHLNRIAGIRLSQIRRLEAAGIRTVSQLASDPPRRVPGMRQETLERLVVQARLQVGSRGAERPLYEVRPASPDVPRRGLALLPPGSPSDIYFDMEGFPLVEGGHEYLFGAVTIEEEKHEFHDWWAHTEVEEKAAFEAFIDWAYARWKRDPTLHIYHYAAYETTTLRRLMGKYATREHEVDDLLRNDVFVDLYPVVTQGLVIGTPGYSLKDIEHLYSESRSGDVTSAAGSIVAYERWLESGEAPTWQESPILAEIREYNRQDCDSLRKLVLWLRDVQAASEIAFQEKARREPRPEKDETEKRPETLLMERLLAEVAGGRISDDGRRRLQELLAWLLEFHWREMKPLYWRRYERAEMTEEELVEDINCLGGLEQDHGRPFVFRFDPEAQDSKLDEGDRCLFASDLEARATIEKLDWTKGIVEIRPGRSAAVPSGTLALIPDEYVNPKPIPQAVSRYVEGWAGGKILSPAVDDLLNRRPPRVRGRPPGPLVQPGDDLIPQLGSIVGSLDSSVLCIQGPPGTGKTYTAGRVIVDLMRKGNRVGVMANSHKAILKLLTSVVEASGTPSFRVMKAGGDSTGDEFRTGRIQHVGDSGRASRSLGGGPFTIGGTAWLFARPDMAGKLDYLFVDEAGQVSLANIVGTGLSTRNIVLVGDQMQLAQPIQGSHPGESGRSALEYLLQNHPTIPPERGVFLDTTYRMHPDVCQFISEAIYEGRLHSYPDTAKQRIELPASSAKHVRREAGCVFLPVPHEGNTQASEEEVEVVAEVVRELVGRRLVAKDESDRLLAIEDILVVAPYNMQVRRIARRLGPKARVASVDKFQGQEAPVVIVSMCASSLAETPRGADFLLSRNRLNVAISRAKCLSIVVASPALLFSRCTTLEQMKLVNLFCRFVSHAGSTS